jgi:hypothetical protein
MLKKPWRIERMPVHPRVLQVTFLSQEQLHFHCIYCTHIFAIFYSFSMPEKFLRMLLSNRRANDFLLVFPFFPNDHRLQTQENIETTSKITPTEYIAKHVKGITPSSRSPSAGLPTLWPYLS